MPAKTEQELPIMGGSGQKDRHRNAFRMAQRITAQRREFRTEIQHGKYEETNKNSETKWLSWVTGLTLDRDTVMLVMRSGYRRWTTEIETFKTLKAGDGYNFEHNFDHGKEHLAGVVTMLKMLAFLLD